MLAGTAVLACVALTACTSAAPAFHHSAARTGASSGNASTPAVAGPTTAVPAPTSGNASVPAATDRIRTAAPVALDAVATAHAKSAAALVRIQSVQAITAKASGLPGEVAGPAVRVVVRFENRASTAAALSQVYVTLVGAGNTPGVPMHGNGSQPFTGTLAPKASATGSYVFTIASAARRHVAVTVDYASARTAVVFQGRVR